MNNLSVKQQTALEWVKKYETLPPVEPNTWKSLIRKGLIELKSDGSCKVLDNAVTD